MVDEFRGQLTDFSKDMDKKFTFEEWVRSEQVVRCQDR